MTTLADALRDAARDTPDRILLRDDEATLSSTELLSAATSLAHALVRRMPVGSVVSFAVPNWREAAVIYLGATLAGMVVNPILPSLRERELSFILADAGSRAIFIPQTFGGHDYAAMLDRVVAGLPSPPEVVVVR
ncbi:AMP-binding protein, partial [Mycolicibacterium sp.]